MDPDEAVTSTEHGTLPDLPPIGASTNRALLQSLRENATSISAADMPLPPSSPVNSPQLPPRLRMDATTLPRSPSSNQRTPSSRYLNPERSSSTPFQTSQRSPSSPLAARPTTPSRSSTIRSASSSLTTSSASTAQSRSSSGSTIRDVERKPPVTANSLAQDYFKRDLSTHDNVGAFTKTVVIIRDSCYGHRFSRPRTSKAALSTIVERPERLHACILGASTAYVRIGGRHAGGQFPPHPNRDVPPPPFQIRKTTRSVPLNNAAVTQVHGRKWMEELQIMCDSAEGKLAMNGRELVRPIGYGKDEAGISLPKLHEGDLYLCSESLDALQGCLGGVCEAVDTVFGPDNTKRTFVCIRPPGHHCSSNIPSGFCWLNNVHVGIAHAAISHGLTHAAIIDFDLHHGDGSQAIAWDHNRKAAGNLPKSASPYSRTPIGYFSLHDINSYPCEWGDEEKIKNASLCVENAHGQSIWNVHLEPWKNHTEFWKLYQSRYSILLEKTRIFLRQHTTRIEGATNSTKAKAAIFLSAGFDASEWEGSGMQRHKVNVPTDFYARFTSDVVRLAEEEGIGVDGRIISVLEGGYSDRALTSGVLSHLCGLTSDSGHAGSGSDNIDSGLAMAMASQMSMHDTSASTNGDGSAAAISYNSHWWHTECLETLETLVNPVPTAPAKPKDRAIGNYSSPTQASTAKMTEPARERRSMSAQLEARMSAEPETIQPPPDVDWAVASYELSRLLIPTDRQTLSCKHEELNAEATKVRRERQSAIGLPSNDVASGVDQRMQLRDRKAKAPVVNNVPKVASKADRRRTIAAVGDLPDPDSLQDGDNKSTTSSVNNRPRRRSSAASSLLSALESMNLSDHGSQPSEASAISGQSKTVPNQNDGRISRVSTNPAKAPVQRKVKQQNVNVAQANMAQTNSRKSGSIPLVPKVPNAFLKNSSSASKDATDQAQSSLHRTDSTISAVKADDDLDSISSGMKKMKINLKVPSPEENAAREEKAVEERNKAKKPRAPRKSAVPKSAKPGVTKKEKGSLANSTTTPPTVVESAMAEDENRMPVDMVTPVIQSEEQPPSSHGVEQSAPGDEYVPTTDIAHAEPPLQATIPAPVAALVESGKIARVDSNVDMLQQMPDTSSADDHQASNFNMPEHVPSSPPLPPQPEQQADLLDRPLSEVPASAPPTVKKTRADLPQFTASSPIPFAKTEQNKDTPSTRPAKANLDLPSPADPSKITENTNAIDAGETKTTHPQFSIQAQQPSLGKAAVTALIPNNGDDDPSIWEVPETPAPSRH